MTGGIDIRGARGRAAGLVAALLLVLAISGPGAEQASAGPCPNADAGIDEASAKQLATAVRCLINRDRAERDLHQLANDGKLRRAAAKHNAAMLKENCWAHDCPGEPNLGRRIRNTGYLDGARRWSYGENFGCANTPSSMLSTWLQTPFSRSNIRKPEYRDIGVAAARDQVPASECDEGTEITFTAVFARRIP